MSMTTEAPERLSQPDVDPTTVKACTDVAVPPTLAQEAALAAIQERADNLVAFPGMAVMMATGFDEAVAEIASRMDEPVRPEMVVLALKRWQPGRVLRVRFLDGPAVVREKIEHFARQWEPHCSLRFCFGDDPDAEVRISCTLGIGSWSYLGTDALVIPKSQPTMNFGWFTENTPDNEYRRTVVHEFGHALACVHEHMHPEGGIPWDEERVYHYYERTQGWSRAETYRNVLARYRSDEVNASVYDRRSIMHYPIPPELLRDPNYAVGWNTELSERDRAFIRTQYP
jgi:serralysin